jgi:addiction module HigA family antidote
MTTRATPRTTSRKLISRADLDAGRVDFSTVDSGVRLAAIHPGVVLRHEFLEPLHLTAHALALALRVPANRISAILAGRRAVTAETALRLARHFRTTPGFWLNLQKAYELEQAERQAGARIRAEVSPRAAV